MTPDELTAIEQRAEAATPGPWAIAATVEDGLRHGGIGCFVASFGEMGGRDWFLGGGFIVGAAPGGRYGATAQTDATFAAFARTDVPALCREVRRLTDRLRLLFDENANLDADIGRLTAELAELRKRPTLEQALSAIENATWYHGESYETARRVVRQLYAEEQPHD